MRNANSASITFMCSGAAGRRAPSARMKFLNSRPASGSVTPICACPALLVAAIFQPETGCAALATIASWIA